MLSIVVAVIVEILRQLVATARFEKRKPTAKEKVFMQFEDVDV